MHYLVADIARTITLYPGDVLLSGTPANSRTVYPGDVVEVEVEGLGRLTNHIVSRPDRRSATTSARSRPRARRSSRPRWAATGSSAASALPSGPEIPLPNDSRPSPLSRRNPPCTSSST